MKQNKKGFTLLEIIIVIVIIGILAALALTRLTPLIETSKGGEAVAAFTTIRGSLERCNSEQGGSYANCILAGNTANMDAPDPGTLSGAHFSYVLSNLGANTYIITATRTTRDDPSNNAGTTLILTNNGTIISITGSNPLTNPYRKFFRTGN